MTDTPATERAQAAASTATDEGKHVAGVAQQEARNVAGEATAQARTVVDGARTHVSGELGDQTRKQRDKLVSTLGTFGDDLEQMADAPDGGLAAQVAGEVAQRARQLTGYLEDREPGTLLDDARDLARRRPAVFLLGALAAGVVAGRLARGVKDDTAAATTAPSSTTTSSTPGVPTTAGVVPVQPVPPVTPVDPYADGLGSPVPAPTTPYGTDPSSARGATSSTTAAPGSVVGTDADVLGSGRAPGTSTRPS